MRKILLYALFLLIPTHMLIGQGIVNSGYIKIATGAYIDITSGGVKTITRNTNDGKITLEGSITLDKDWVNNSSDVVFSPINTSGTVIFNGANEQTISGTNQTSFENLVINKISDTVRLSSDIAIYNSLTMNSGCIDLQNNTIDFGTLGNLSGENATNYIYVSDPMNHTGTLTASAVVNNQDINIANIGFEVNSSENLGLITVTRGHKRQSGFDSHSSDQGISRYYESNIGELSDNTTIKMYYRDGELNAADQPDENNLVLYQMINDGSKALSYTPLNANINTSTNTIETSAYPYNDWVKNNPSVTFLNNFTLGSTETPLPLELIYFKANCVSETGETALMWATASEINIDRYIVEHSNDFEIWELLTEIKASDNSSSLNEYSCKHNQQEESNYYRLVELTTDGTRSAIKTIEKQCFSQTHFPHISAISTKNRGEVQLTIYSPHNSTYTFTVVDILGHVLFNQKTNLLKGENTLILHPSGIKTGIVCLTIQNYSQIIAREKLVLKN